MDFGRKLQLGSLVKENYTILSGALHRFLFLSEMTKKQALDGVNLFLKHPSLIDIRAIVCYNNCELCS